MASGEDTKASEPAAATGSWLGTFRYADTLDILLICCGVILQIGGGAMMPIFMSLFSDMMGSFGNPVATAHPFMWYIKAQLILGACSMGLNWIGSTCIVLSAERQVHRLQIKFLGAVLKQEIGWFDSFDTGRLASQLSQDLAVVRDGIGMKFAQIFMAMGMAVGGYVVAFIRDWKMTLVISAAIPILGVTAVMFFRQVSQRDTVARNSYAEASSIVEETLVAVRSVIAFGLEQRQLSQFSSGLDRSFAMGMRGAIATGLGLGVMLSVVFLTYSLGFWYGGKRVADDIDAFGLLCFSPNSPCFSGADALAVFFSVIIAAFSLGQASPNITSFGKAAGAVESLSNIINRESAIDSTQEDGIRPTKLKGQIQFRDVAFKYPTRVDQPIFGRLNLTIPAGKSVALVGGSGCGKSTCIQLLERFYDPERGEVSIDGTDLRAYHLKSVRKQMALVSQEPRLFAATIAENIGVGKENATMEEIIEAARRANAHDFISTFPQKYETFCGEGGTQLSGGQKQRIAIARAILRNPSILILDEATSALDNESEKIVQQTLDKLVEAQERTTVIIAHRLSTVRNCDLIVVLDRDDEGSKVVEQGTHAELMAMPQGLYRGLVEAQSLQLGESDDVAPLAETFAHDLPKRAGSIARLSSKFSRAESKQIALAEEELTAKQLAKQKKEKQKGGPGKWSKVLSLITPYKLMIGVGLLGAALNGAVFPAFAIILGKFVGVFFLPDAAEIRDKAAFWACVFIGFAAAVFVANFLQHSSFGWAGQKVVQKIRYQTFDAIVHQDMSFFDDPANTSGALSSILSGDCLMLKGWVGDNLGIFMQNIAAVIVALIVSFTASPKLAAVALASCCVMLPAQLIEAQFTLSTEDVTTKDDSKPEVEAGKVDTESVGFVMQEAITNIRTVDAYSLENFFEGRYLKIVDKRFAKGKTNAYMSGFAWGLSQFSQFAMQALCFWYGGKLQERGELTSEQMLQAIFGLMMAAMGAAQNSIFMTDLSAARDAANRVYTVLEREPLVDARSAEGKAMQAVQNAVVYDHVSFRYPQRLEVPVYDQMCFDIKAGEVVALVGPSGCGKSTAVQLLQRFYDLRSDITLPVGPDGREIPQSSGAVMIDGTNIRNINVKSLRAHMGLVGQEPALFDTTLAENIAIGHPNGSASMEEIVHAAELANAATFIKEFPEGYETRAGRLGGKLSGGQKQRIAIARAIIRDPDILILDEATSALDSESEKVVQAALDDLLQQRKRTTIVIAHRLSTVRRADKIIVLVNRGKGSKVAETGSHEQLMAVPNGVYARLCRIAEGREGV